MKIDKASPRHWAWLLLFGAWTLAAIVARPFLRTRRRAAPRRRVVLYGHKLGGNLLALHRHLTEAASDRFEVQFLHMDPHYVRQLRAGGVDAIAASRPACACALALAHAVVSDHGLHAMLPLLGLSDVRFYDVWHGIPFKGFDADDFRVQHRFDETWVASPLLAGLYASRFGFDPRRVHAIGYARTDALVKPRATRSEILASLGLAARDDSRFVLFAPTWKQDAGSRSLFPFGLDETRFVVALSARCEAHGATLLVRKHLNSDEQAEAPPGNAVYLPYAAFPDTEAILQASDILVCDWSSIAFDYLLLDRPAIFLDVAPPFRKGFSLGPEYRYGPVVDGFEALLAQVEAFLADPGRWQRDHAPRAREIRQRVYGDCADGHAARRAEARLLAG